MKTLNTLTWQGLTRQTLTFSSSSQTLLAMSNTLIAQGPGLGRDYLLTLSVDPEELGDVDPSDGTELLPEGTRENMKLLLYKASLYITGRSLPLHEILSTCTLHSGTSVEIRISSLLPPDCTTPLVATTVWRLVNAWTWCLLPNRRKLTTSPLSRHTWDAISLYVDPTVLARNGETPHAETTSTAEGLDLGHLDQEPQDS